MHPATQALVDSIDVLSLNHYSTHLVSAAAEGDPGDTSSGWMADQRLHSAFGRSWPASASPWQRAYPHGIRLLLRWAAKRWQKKPIMITENGRRSSARCSTFVVPAAVPA